MNIPRLMLVTDRNLMRGGFEDALQQALEGGAELVQLREKDLARPELLILAHRAQLLCEAAGAHLLVNADAVTARLAGTGWHVPERSLGELPLRPSAGGWCGASVHSVEAAQRAQALGADYLVFGSIFPTPSHPGEAPAGVEHLRTLVSQVELPVFGIGGITNEARVRQCLQAGAHGVAVLSAAWQASDVRKTTQQFVEWVNDD